MKNGLETLFSKYIIDGVTKESTPADMLRECFYDEDWSRAFPASDSKPGTVIDETADRDPAPLKYDPALVGTYLEGVKAKLDVRRDGHHSLILSHPVSSVRILIAESVIKTLWRRGEVRLEDLGLCLSVLWDSGPVGNMAALHAAIDSAAGYIYELGLHIADLDYCERPGDCEMNFRITPPGDCGDLIPERLADRDDTVLVYVPFDTCSHKLGGSLLGEVLGRGDETGPEISDPDYFMDSFEVVHDLVQDGVVLSGVSVSRGGLIAAVDRILGDGWGIELDIGGIRRAYMEDDRVRVLFSELPGVLLQVPESESGYLDSQFLLQDIAYYTVGRPERGGRGISVSDGNRAGLSRILSALINGQPEDPDLSNASEGDEDRGENSNQ